MSAEKVADLYNAEHKTNISKCTLQKYVQQVPAGEPLGQRGPAPGNLSEDTFNLLFQAFESYSKLNQINQQGHLNTHGGWSTARCSAAIPSKSWGFVSQSATETNDNWFQGKDLNPNGGMTLPLDNLQ